MEFVDPAWQPSPSDSVHDSPGPQAGSMPGPGQGSDSSARTSDYTQGYREQQWQRQQQFMPPPSRGRLPGWIWIVIAVLVFSGGLGGGGPVGGLVGLFFIG